MEYYRPVRKAELARIANVTRSAVTQRLKNDFEISGRTYDLDSLTVENYLKSKDKFSTFYENTALYVISVQTGGAGKTSATINLAIAARRIIDPKTAVVIIDADSQGSTTQTLLGKETDDDTPCLNHYITGSIKRIEDLLVPIGEEKSNLLLMRSNLSRNLYNDRAMGDPTLVRNKMKNLVDDIVKKYGPKTKIFVDTPPQLSAVGQSFILAAADIPIGCLLVPIRPDGYGVTGARVCLEESINTLMAFNVDPRKIKLNCFMSSHNSKTTASSETLKKVMQDKVLSQFISRVMIRYTSDLPKLTFPKENNEGVVKPRLGGVFESAKHINTIGSDYMDLLLSVVD